AGGGTLAAPRHDPWLPHARWAPAFAGVTSSGGTGKMTCTDGSRRRDAVAKEPRGSTALPFPPCHPHPPHVTPAKAGAHGALPHSPHVRGPWSSPHPPCHPRESG